MSVKRIWHGWTSKNNASKYENILRKIVLPSIEEKSISGYQKIEVLREEHEDEVEFITIMTFESLQNVIDFQGEDYKKCYVPKEAQAVLKRWDKTSAHLTVIETRRYI